MNAKRRNKLKEVMSHIEEAASLLSEVMEEEQECMDNLPENLQDSEKYSDFEDRIDMMNDALADLTEVSNYVSDVMA